MKIVVLDGYTLNPGDNPWTPVEKLGEFVCYERTENDQILERARPADILLTNKTPLTAATLAHLPELKYISVLATGFNVVDIQAARQKNIPVSNVPVYGTDSVAQFTFALMLELCHHVGLHDQAVKNMAWSHGRDFCFWNTPLIELSGKILGIVGFGRIGRRVAQIAHALNMNLLVYDKIRSDSPPAIPIEWLDLPDLFARADIVSLHCPLTSENQGLVNTALLNTMSSRAMLINTARGTLINEPDLALALNTERIAGAALDVVSTEPIKENNPLLHAKNCIITPHIAWATLSARQRLMQTTTENIAAFLQGKPVNVVN